MKMKRMGTFRRKIFQAGLGLLAFSLFAGKSFSEHDQVLALRLGFTAVALKTQVDVNSFFVDYLGGKLHIPVKIVFAPLYSDMSRMLKNEEVDIAYVCGAPYVLDHDSFGLELLATPAPAISMGAPVYRSYIIVRKDSPYRSLSDLKGKRYAFSDPLSNSGKLVPTYLLAKEGYKVEEYFHSYFYTYSHSNSIEAVAMNLADAASVDSYVWESHQSIDPIYSKETKVIHQSPEYPFTPFVVRKSLDPGIKAKVRQILIEMHQDPRGKKILDEMFIQRFVILEDKDYDPIREMLRFVDHFKGDR
jgi:phosphonate transport system substrate-binding protein